MECQLIELHLHLDRAELLDSIFAFSCLYSYSSKKMDSAFVVIAVGTFGSH